MRKEIQFKLRQVGIIKPYLAVYIIEDILGNDSTNCSQNQTEILERLSKAISWGEDVIADLRKNNCATPRFEEFLFGRGGG